MVGMTSGFFRLRVLLLALLAVVLAGVSVPAQTTEEELTRVEAELARIQAEVFQLSEDYQAAWATDADLANRIEQLEASIIGYTVEQIALQNLIRERAADLYMSNPTSNELVALLLLTSPADIDTRVEYIEDVRERDQSLFNSLLVLTSQINEALDQLQQDRAEHQMVLNRLEELSVTLNERLAAGQELYDLLEERRAEELAREEAARLAREAAEREAAERAAFLATSTTTTFPPSTTTTTVEVTTTLPTTTSTPVQVTDTTLPFTPTTTPVVTPSAGATTCPVDGFHSFTDTWGAPRSGGRTHQGVDILADRGIPVVAAEDGIIVRMFNGGRGGITATLEGNSGDVYYYAHLDAWAPGLEVGLQVSAGEALGIVGTTGNAPAHIPHLHWEYQPGGGASINPTPLARSLCG